MQKTPILKTDSFARSALRFYHCGYEKCAKGHFFGPAVRTHYLVHFVLSGKGVYRTGKKEYAVHKNEGFFIRPQELTYYEADSQDPWEYVWLAFDGEAAEKILKPFGLCDTVHICKSSDPDKLSLYLQQSLACLKNPEHSQMELTGWFYLFFSCLKKEAGFDLQDSDYCKHALQYMRSNYMYSITIDDVSASVGIDRTYLYKLCKKYMNVSPKEFLTNRRISAAKDMLQFSQYSTTEIAFSCGFGSSSAFCKTFKQLENMSPSQYRAKVRT